MKVTNLKAQAIALQLYFCFIIIVHLFMPVVYYLWAVKSQDKKILLSFIAPFCLASLKYIPVK